MILKCGHNHCKLKYETPDLILGEAIECLNSHIEYHYAENRGENMLLWVMQNYMPPQRATARCIQEEDTQKGLPHASRRRTHRRASQQVVHKEIKIKARHLKRPYTTSDTTKHVPICSTSPVRQTKPIVSSQPAFTASLDDPIRRHIPVKQGNAVKPPQHGQ